ncbi:MAG: Aspartate aminotransferase [Alphaproteobacteria bacterium MarineAlpha6_Bin6]|nr:aspartate aminotransferase [Pelagibacteraceae bacterium]PPR31358.1 MAG: Aspartate aminotransferase [Alphaproteobacteria bacterium MarineAlpha6_Bin6]PPR33492.1 MAG: Aspartate aminotransferase [Alphaproteobacteria bacterium MarineAlpha6_Bin5]|tara:strand:+ start:1172 stop:2371 length:1200 start_codon:yes stop_codon:yes gene_type:complete
MSIFSQRLSRIQPSPTIAITSKAKKLKQEGKQIIDFSAGEPDFDTPDNVKKVAIEAINNGQTKYTPVNGTKELIESIIKKFKRENDLVFEPDEITVGCGGKQVIFNALLATIEKGDEIIIPAPFWVSYPDMALLVDGQPVVLDCSLDNNFKINPQDLENKITNKTKWIILNSPSNPTGAFYTEMELQNLAKILLKHPHVWIMCDDLYEHIIFDNLKFKNILQVDNKLRSRTFVVNGVSKAYAMTGWRVGYGAGPKELIKEISKIQSQSTTHTSSISQAAAIEALDNSEEFIKKNKKIFQERRDLIYSKLKDFPLLQVFLPQGSFYTYICCNDIIGKKKEDGTEITNDLDLSDYLLDEGVAVVPGEAFGCTNFLRISFATSNENIIEGCDKIISACKKLK